MAMHCVGISDQAPSIHPSRDAVRAGVRAALPRACRQLNEGLHVRLGGPEKGDDLPTVAAKLE